MDNSSAMEMNHDLITIEPLSDYEIAQVSGGMGPLQGFEDGAVLGTVGGAVLTGTTIGATRGGVIGGALGFAWGLGWGIGTSIYNTSRKLL